MGHCEKTKLKIMEIEDEDLKIKKPELFFNKIIEEQLTKLKKEME